MNYMETSNAQNKISVYYDGLCKVCSFEIEHYKKQAGAENIGFVDITNPLFDAAREGVDPFLVHKYLHTKTEDGQIISGVETSRLIWSYLPKYQWAYRLSANSLVRGGLEAFYKIFVAVRPYLPRKKDLCSDSPYCETHK